MGLKLVMSFSVSNVVSLVRDSVAVRMSQQRCWMVLLKGGASSISAEVSVSLVEMTVSIAGEDFPYAGIQFISTMLTLIVPAEREGFVNVVLSFIY